MSYPEIAISELEHRGAASIQTGPFGTQLKASHYTHEGVPVINVRNIGYGGLRLDKLEFVSEETAERLRVHVLEENDIVFGRKGAVDRHLLVSESENDWLQGSDCIRLRLDPKHISPRFVSYAFLRTYHKEWMLTQCGNKATMASLNQDVIRRITLPLPKADQQREITKILSAYDDLIENNRRRIGLLEEAVRLLYREWFVYFRFPGHEHVTITNGLPEGWGPRTIKEMTEFLGRGISPSYDDEADFLVVNQKCIRDRMLSMTPARRQKKEFPSAKALQFLDILINSTGTGTLGRVAQCWFTPTGVSFDSHVTVARPNESVDPYWFGYALLALESVFEGMGEGATNQKELAKSRIAAVIISSPPLGLQRDFGLFAADSCHHIQVLAEQNEKLLAARDLLLPRLMSGEIAV